MFPLCHPKPQIKNFHLRLRLSLDIKQTPTEHLMMSVGCAVQGQVEEIDCVSTLSIRSSPWGILNGVFLGPWNPPPGWSTLSWCLFRQHVTKGPGWKLPTPVPMRWCSPWQSLDHRLNVPWFAEVGGEPPAFWKHLLSTYSAPGTVLSAEWCHWTLVFTLRYR